MSHLSWKLYQNDPRHTVRPPVPHQVSRHVAAAEPRVPDVQAEDRGLKAPAKHVLSGHKALTKVAIKYSNAQIILFLFYVLYINWEVSF